MLSSAPAKGSVTSRPSTVTSPAVGGSGGVMAPALGWHPRGHRGMDSELAPATVGTSGRGRQITMEDIREWSPQRVSGHGHQAGTSHHGGHQGTVTGLAPTTMGTSGHGHHGGCQGMVTGLAPTIPSGHGDIRA